MSVCHTYNVCTVAPMSLVWMMGAEPCELTRALRGRTTPWPDTLLAQLPYQRPPFPAPASHGPYTRAQPACRLQPSHAPLTARTAGGCTSAARVRRAPAGHGDGLLDSATCGCGRAPSRKHGAAGKARPRGCSSPGHLVGQEGPTGEDGDIGRRWGGPLGPVRLVTSFSCVPRVSPQIKDGSVPAWRD